MEELKKHNLENIIPISVEEEIGIEDLKKKIEDIFNTSHLDYKNTLIITNERHRCLLNDSIKNLEKAKDEINNNMPIDIISIYLNDATRSLSEIIGENISADVAKKIFEKFCIGK